MRLYRVTTNYFCCGVMVENDIIKETAPIMSWARGKSLLKVMDWVRKKKGTIEEMREDG